MVTVEAGDALTISVVDDGVRVPAQVARSGMRNLKQRAVELGGTCTVTGEPGGGTLCLPKMSVQVRRRGDTR
ncbi:hypothetical protein [Actinosynnema sp. NPDC023587]|uniref:hypothetical protein n=1 Tax=Actinosynnema sp. NPDC023587 TaxID=3154695 RepID=UPI00340B2312